MQNTEKEAPSENRASDSATSLARDVPAGDKLIVLTAPLTESIDHAGFFIQMALASIPQWLEFVLDKKYPKWREVERNEDGSARYMPADNGDLPEGWKSYQDAIPGPKPMHMVSDVPVLRVMP